MDVKYVAQIEHVREVSLLGTADLTYWRQRMQPLGLVPRDVDGAAQFVVSATNARFKGVRFRELSLALVIEPVSDCPGEHSYFLMQAFNSCRLFAFIERRLFSTPYLHGEVQSQVELPANVRLNVRGAELLAIEMAKDLSLRSPQSVAMESWTGPILLPPAKHEPTKVRRWFMAKISGETEVYRFEPAGDTFRMTASPSIPALGWLGESGFMPTTWLLRKDAQHGKSKTYVVGSR